jgi:hypothetical protein
LPGGERLAGGHLELVLFLVREGVDEQRLAVPHEQAPAAEEGFIYGLPIVMNCAE